MSTEHARLFRRARRYLSIWACNIGLDNDLGLTDINHAAENLLCELLNIVLGLELKNLNLLQMNFPAIDLADEEKGICVQVTSTEGREKIEHTLEKFYEHRLQEKYTRLIVMILGEKKRYRGTFDQRNGFRFDKTRDIWDMTVLLQHIDGLPLERMQAVDDYLRRQLGPLVEAPEPLNLPPRTGMAAKAFLGRGAELEQIREAFQEERIVFLSGLGGMGKTELAVRFGALSLGRTYFATFHSDWETTLVSSISYGVPGLDRQNMDQEEILAGTLAALEKCAREDLLILDNADGMAESPEQLRRKLSGLPLRFLVTTRSEIAEAIPVDALRMEELREIFHYNDVSIDQKDMDDLIEAVDRHTLTVDLMARSMGRGRRAATAERFLDALNARDLSSPRFTRVATTYPGGPAQARINEHLRTVFRVSELKDEEQELLRCATLIPAAGMDDALFLAPFEEEMADVLDDLIDHGWLELNEDELLHIHPVIRIVCREELKPTDESCSPFLHALRAQYDPNEAYDKEKYRQLAEAFTLAAEDLEDREGNWAIWAGYFWSKLGEAKAALDCNQKMVQNLEESMPDSSALATAYNNLGNTYSDLGDHNKALEYLLKALAIYEKVLPGNLPGLARSYNNVGSTYGNLGNHKKELEYLTKAIEIFEADLPENHLDLARSYDNMGTTYYHLFDHERALEYQRKAMEIFEAVLPGNHPDLAQSYNNVGGTYNSLGDHKRALEYLLKALALWEAVLPQNHSDLAKSYNNVGSTYSYLGDHEKALKYLLKALAILEQTLPANHPTLATFCNNIAITYARLDNFDLALVYIRRAVQIADRPGQPHPDLAFFRQIAKSMEQVQAARSADPDLPNPFKQ